MNEQEEKLLPRDFAPQAIMQLRERGQTFTVSGRKSESFVTARKTLLSILKPEQIETFELFGFAEVTGSSGKRYRVHYRRGNNVSQLNLKGVAFRGADCHLPESFYEIPLDINIVAQILALRTNDIEFAQISCGIDPIEFNHESYIHHNHITY